MVVVGSKCNIYFLYIGTATFDVRLAVWGRDDKNITHIFSCIWQALRTDTNKNGKTFIANTNYGHNIYANSRGDEGPNKWWALILLSSSNIYNISESSYRSPTNIFRISGFLK